MKKQQLLSYTRRAIDDYQMIQDKDRIAIGISGGKDSLALLHALSGLKIFYPIPFEIVAVTVDLGFDNIQFDKIQDLCDELHVPYHIVKTDIAQIVFQDRKETNPCSLCAKMRKGALNQAMKELGCNKIAYAHHKDDVVETMILSLLFEGRFHSFAPVTYLDRMDMTVIRPMIYVQEADVIGFVKKENLPVIKSPCPVDGLTKREDAHDLLAELMQKYPGVKERMFTAIQRGHIKGWSANDEIQLS